MGGPQHLPGVLSDVPARGRVLIGIGLSHPYMMCTYMGKEIALFGQYIHQANFLLDQCMLCYKVFGRLKYLQEQKSFVVFKKRHHSNQR